MDKYSGLDGLLQSNKNANQYFNSLPDSIKEQLVLKSGDINSLAVLEGYAQNFIRGDE